MEVDFTPEQRTRLHQVATRSGRDPKSVIEDSIDRMLDYDECFLAAVETGRAGARRGDLLEHDEVVERNERMIRA